jgi:small conductance mechanosensitive channel
MALVGAVLLAVAALPARAQTAAPAAAAAPAATVSADDLQHLVDTIQDPTERQHLITTLQGLIAAQRGAPAQPTPTTFLDRVTAQVDAITGEILTAAQVVVDAPRLVGWIESQIGDRAARDFWFAVAVRLALIFGIGFIADRLVYLLLRAPARRIESAPGSRIPTQLALMLLCFAIAILPAVAFALAATFAVPFMHVHYGTVQVAHVLINAILWSRIVLAAARVVLLAPSAVALYPLGGETRHYLYIWMRRFTGWAVYGYAVASGAWWLGVPGAIYALLLRGTTLVLATLGIVFVLQNRKTVADWLRGNGHGSASWRLLRLRLAETWHVLAIIYVVGTFGMFLLDVQGGFLFLLRATVSTVVVLLAAALLVRGIERMTRQGFAVSPEQRLRYPTLEARANRYLPVLYYVTASVIYSFGALAILQAWGVNAFGWLGTEAGRSAAGTIVTIVLVVVTALISWEFFSSGIERYLHATDGSGSPVARSARARTLLPLLRTTVLVVVIVLVGLVVLSQVGVNIAPLLAGAGVVGLAVGFGSQALVKDVINGLFILVEDTLAVGETVDVGNNHAGVVEAISIRAIRIRDGDGTVHTVPFSDVTTVKNMSRDFAYYNANISVSYREDTDQVIAVLRAVADEMRAEPAFKPLMLEPMEVIGVDRFADSAVVIQIRFKAPPNQQWGIGREFNRRMKKAFDEHGIEMPFPHRTLYFGTNRRGDAPPIRIALDQPPPEKPAD